MEVDEVFSSRPRMKILKLIFELGALNVSEIARRTGLNFTSTDKHLRLLESEGVLQERTYGRVRMYRFDEAQVKAKAVQNLISVWEQANKK